jgi:hypothetical protein
MDQNTRIRIPRKNCANLHQRQCFHAKYAANCQGKYACITVRRWLTGAVRPLPLILDKTVALATLVYASAAFRVQLAANQRKQK